MSQNYPKSVQIANIASPSTTSETHSFALLPWGSSQIGESLVYVNNSFHVLRRCSCLWYIWRVWFRGEFDSILFDLISNRSGFRGRGHAIDFFVNWTKALVHSNQNSKYWFKSQILFHLARLRVLRLCMAECCSVLGRSRDSQIQESSCRRL